MNLTKSELHHGGDDVLRKGWTNRFFHDMIDSLWREPFINRTSGFDVAGGPDSVIAFDNATRIFTISPKINRFSFWQYNVNISFFKRTESLELEIPDEEGLYLIYIFRDEEDKLRKTQKLFLIKNPTETQRRDVYETKVVVANIYWDSVNGTAVHVGDDRHGSEWPPQIHWYLHNAIGARRKSGLYFTNMIVNGDGSSNDHAKFSIEGGVMLHDDFELTIPDSEIEMPILNFYTDHAARFAYYTGFSVWKGNNRLCYNASQTHVAEAANGNFVVYHYFATNDILPPNGDGIHRKIISVMGANEYTSLGAAYLNTEAELAAIMPLMPQQGRCYIGSVIFQTADEYTNTIKARVVGLVGNEKSHPPVTIAADSKTYLEIDEKQELKFLPAGSAYNWKLHSPEEIIGYLTVPSGLAVNVDGIGAIIESVAVGQLKVTAINAQGETTAADVPAFDVLADSTQAMISWDAVAGASGYRAYNTATGYYKAVTGVGINYIGFVFDTLGDPPTENTAAIYQTAFTIDNGDTVQFTGEGVDVETSVDPLDGTKKRIHLTVNPGLDGLSAYEVAVSNGFVGTEAEWLASLVGDDGYTPEKGVDYFDGDDGTDGLSAYEVAVSNGFVGTEAEWLASLQGDDGVPGQDGEDATTTVTITQNSHGFIVGDAIKVSPSTGTWVKAQADNATNAGTLGIVCDIIDANTFSYQYGGILAAGTWTNGESYFLSPTTAGAIITEPASWTIGQVREFLGTGTPEGLLVEIDVGDEIIVGEADSGTEDDHIGFEFRDVTPGTAMVYILDPKANFPYTIVGAVLYSDAQFSSVSVKIGAASISGIANVVVTSLAEFTAQSGNQVAPGNQVTLDISTAYVGSPTLIGGKLMIMK